MARKIRVGLVGASPDRGWARQAHLPAFRASPEFELTAVATSRPDTAERARSVYGVPYAFADARQLADHPEVDLVVVSVRVSRHLELVGIAIAAGKAVHCEWPLASNSAGGRALVDQASAAGIGATLGLQGRFSPSVGRMAELVAAGAVGELTSAKVITTRTKGSAREVSEGYAYTADAAQCAGTLNVLGGHTLDGVQSVIGPIVEVDARLAVQRPDHVIAETGEPLLVTAPDHVLAIGSTATGALVSVTIHDTVPSDAGTLFEVTGTTGQLRLTGAEHYEPNHNFHVSEMLLHGIDRPGGHWRVIEVAPDRYSELPVLYRNIARLYGALGRDIREGSNSVPTFQEGVTLHRLIEAIEVSDRSGTRQRLAPPRAVG
jgi:predicted dehydrogenase